MTKTNNTPAHRVTYEVRRDDINPKRWCIYNRYLKRVEEGGFFTREGAELCLDRNYDLSR